MEKLKQEDKEKLSRILTNNWDSVFRWLTGSSVDEYDVPYREVYKWELKDITKDYLDMVDTYLENNAFYDRQTVRNWLVREIVGGLLGYTDCRNFSFFSCVNNLYNETFQVIKPYFTDLYPNKKKCESIKVIETNLSMKDDKVFDHQSRVVEVDSWEDYIKIFTEYEGRVVDIFKSIIEMVGNSIPKDVEILNLKYDDYHLTCDLKHKDGWIEKKLSYKSKFRYSV